MKKENQQANTINNVHPSSLRNVAVWGIRAAHTLYSALQGCGMTKRVARGFTLIELLVVVLIIGILAAVAVPQYQKAVTKSRLATLKNLTKSIAEDQEIYYLANGKYATTFEDLIIQVPTDGELNDSKNTYTYDWGVCSLTESVTACRNVQADISYQKYYDHITKSSAGQTKCLSRNTIADSICLQETKDPNPINRGTSADPYKVYIYQ